METNNSGIVTTGSSVINAYGSTDSTHNAYGTHNPPPAYETNYITQDAPFAHAQYRVDITHDAPPPYRNVTGAQNPAPQAAAARGTPGSQAYRSLPQYPHRRSESQLLVTNAQWRDFEGLEQQRECCTVIQIVKCVMLVIALGVALVIGLVAYLKFVSQ